MLYTSSVDQPRTFRFRLFTNDTSGSFTDMNVVQCLIWYNTEPPDSLSRKPQRPMDDEVSEGAGN